MLWIALHLPRLSLESFAATLPRPAEAAVEPALALQEAHHIQSVNATALALGVRPGMKRATALALAPHIVLGQADRRRDAEALTAVAHAALAFTPQVVLPGGGTRAGTNDDATVLLEVEPSLRCFGGREALQQRLSTAIAPLGHEVHIASAPTPHAAALLARVHRRLHCADLAATRRALEAAPVWLVGPGRIHWDALQGMGLHTLSDLSCLPRSGLARRFGQALLDELDRAFGQRPDPREPVVLPPVFESRLELFARADSAEQLLYGARVLLERLAVWLAARHAFVRRFTLLMDHERYRRSDPSVSQANVALPLCLTPTGGGLGEARPWGRSQGVNESGVVEQTAESRPIKARSAAVARATASIRNAEWAAFGGMSGPVGFAHTFSGVTALEIALAEPSRDVAHLLALLRERLAQLPLPAPTLELRLHAADIACRAPPNSELFPTPRSEREGLVRLLERLQARLGREHIQRLVAVEDHRPERASVLQPADVPLPSNRPGRGALASLAQQPVWLLEAPEALSERAARPLLGGQPLQLLSGPERIETGWWDAGLAERDYFIAQTAEGALVWVFCARLQDAAAEPGWFLHGRFG